MWAETWEPGKHDIWMRPFQSTPPVWAETLPSTTAAITIIHFNPLRPCGRRPSYGTRSIPIALISIHSARVGGDSKPFSNIKSRKIFQSTPPVWAETNNSTGEPSALSRHFNPLRPCGRRRSRMRAPFCHPHFNPLRPCGRRLVSKIRMKCNGDFNPLRPCGRRLGHKDTIRIILEFHSTPPVWAET